mmetsp:Transcript_52451/g.125325  ORF Transcript_52451/g.125325 Transcript_52451/m.125325 type:complete len:430 (-) Transcript_52451:105-1394(-)
MAPSNGGGAFRRVEREMPPSAVRIAEILRAPLPWPLPKAQPNIEVLRRSMSQPRGTDLLGGNDLAVSRISGDSDGMNHLYERVALNIASLQHQAESEREDVERRLESVGNHVDARLASLEARLATCEQRVVTYMGDSDHASMMDASRVLREARALVGGASSEMQAQSRAQCAELELKLQETLQKTDHKVDEATSQLRNAMEQLHYLEVAVTEQSQAFAVMEQELASLSEFGPRTFAELADSMAELQRKFGEQRQNVDAHLASAKAEAERSRRHSEVLQQELLAEISQTIQEEVERRFAWPGAAGAEQGGSSKEEAAKRVEELDGKIGKIRVRVDLHDGRITTVAERIESATQEAVETARQVASQQRSEIMSEVDCQLRILRQRLEGIGELCEELSLRTLAGFGSRRWPQGGGQEHTEVLPPKGSDSRRM